MRFYACSFPSGIVKYLSSPLIFFFNSYTASGIFSPVNNSSTQSHHPPTLKPSTDPTLTLNGHHPSSVREEAPRATRQSGIFPMPTSQVSERGSTVTHTTDTSSRDKHKSTLTRKPSSGKQGLAGNLQIKSTTSINKGEAHTSRKNIQATEINSSTKVEEMAAARLTGSREGMVFDDSFEGRIFSM